MRNFFALSCGLVLLCVACASAPSSNFPPLAGRVVDQADVISQDSREDIAAKSQALEQKSDIQLVVATVNSLGGGDIETYANELFRTWKLGQEQKNNGVLLLVAPNEHKVRIEVGYGLEGTLTDALCSVIISSAIIPQFKSGDFSGGIDHGVDGIISVLNGDSADWQPQPQPQSLLRNDEPGALNTLLPILGFFAVALIFKLIVAGIARLVSGPRGHYVTRGGRRVFVRDKGSSSSSSSSWSSSDSSSSSSSSDSDFSGGGGSSGGGGASGSW
jgi:uncharacterized protein